MFDEIAEQEVAERECLFFFFMKLLIFLHVFLFFYLFLFNDLIKNSKSCFDVLFFFLFIIIIIIILVKLALDTILLLRQLVFCTCTFTFMAEWLSRWTSDQTVVGSTPITDSLIFLCQIFSFFLITIFMIYFSILMCHK